MMLFTFQDLTVWQKAVAFAEAVILMVDELNTPRKHYRLIEQLESSVTSVAMNIAEGKGRYSRKEYVQFLYISRGSLFETITLLEIFKNLKWISQEQYSNLENQAEEICKMINSLIYKVKNN
ncbi:MAG: four helix bundle protein [Methanosarcinales archaeon]|nr:MAG: four helix bundle protein [Methanosarcinales archaeon]